MLVIVTATCVVPGDSVAGTERLIFLLNVALAGSANAASMTVAAKKPANLPKLFINLPLANNQLDPK